MAQKATVCKAFLSIADIDRGLYADRQLTLARHPSENDERMMVRLLAYALCVPMSDDGGALEFAKGMWDPDEPELWQKDLTGQLLQWVEVGQPDERRLVKASGRAERVSVFAFSHAAPIWWAGLSGRVARTRNIEAWLIPAEQSRALADLAGRSMQLQIGRQDGSVWVADGERTVDLAVTRLP
ncbi:MAG TPA: YaeQ family protein [Caldimonas sp.]|nr:YaeQ family protein [Caldimonas sp.]HEX2541900.1 YaeQ family protein [Caldimonas sp.]